MKITGCIFMNLTQTYMWTLKFKKIHSKRRMWKKRDFKPTRVRGGLQGSEGVKNTSYHDSLLLVGMKFQLNIWYQWRHHTTFFNISMQSFVLDKLYNTLHKLQVWHFIFPSKDNSVGKFSHIFILGVCLFVCIQ